ncbi:MAG: Gfo/Idh/MocA family oxidoreductase [Pirellulaceae bacterium]|nr:Gfo/Idh/MocA family oxidoreductase [Pirellulaceae bacterium]
MFPPREDPIPDHGARMSRRGFLEFTGSAALAATGLSLAPGRAFPAENAKKIRIGVVGGNFGAQWHWHEHPNCVVTGVTDLRPDRRERLVKAYGCNTVYDSLETMVKQARDIDAVAVFSGAPDHVKHAEICMARGWHVISAVPACMSLEEAERLVEIKKRTGMSYMMAETSWYRQPVIYARNLYKAGGFGEMYYSEHDYYHDLGDLRRYTEDKQGRRYEPDGSRSWRWGLPPMLYPTHSTGCLLGVSDERITKVSCLGWRGDSPKYREHPFVDNVYRNPFYSAASIMRTDRGHMCRCNVFWRIVGHGERAQWFGDRASLYMPLDGVHGAVEAIRTRGHRQLDVPRYWETAEMLPPAMRHDSGHDGSHVFLAAEFINALVEGREPEIGLERALAMTVPGIIAHESALRDGEQLDVPRFEA